MHSHFRTCCTLFKYPKSVKWLPEILDQIFMSFYFAFGSSLKCTPTASSSSFYFFFFFSFFFWKSVSLFFMLCSIFISVESFFSSHMSFDLYIPLLALKPSLFPPPQQTCHSTTSRCIWEWHWVIGKIAKKPSAVIWFDWFQCCT